jgi:hypothetical protein
MIINNWPSAGGISSLLCAFAGGTPHNRRLLRSWRFSTDYHRLCAENLAAIHFKVKAVYETYIIGSSGILVGQNHAPRFTVPEALLNERGHWSMANAAQNGWKFAKIHVFWLTSSKCPYPFKGHS